MADEGGVSAAFVEAQASPAMTSSASASPRRGSGRRPVAHGDVGLLALLAFAAGALGLLLLLLPRRGRGA